MATVIDFYNIAVNVLSGIGLLYLLYSGRYVVGYRRFFIVITFGLFLSLLGGPLLFAVSDSIRHAIHGLATFFIALGLYDLTRIQVHAETDWAAILFDDPDQFESVDELDETEAV